MPKNQPSAQSCCRIFFCFTNIENYFLYFKILPLKYLFFYLKILFYVCCIIKFFMVKEKNKPVALQIKDYLDSKGTKQIWLAKATGISPEHICNILADRVLLTPENLQKINEVLETDFKLPA